MLRLSRPSETSPLIEHARMLPSRLTAESHGNVSAQPLGLPVVTWLHGIVSGADAQMFLLTGSITCSLCLFIAYLPSFTFFSSLFFFLSLAVGEWEALVWGRRVNSYLAIWQQRINQQLAIGNAFIISSLCILIFPQR